MTILQDHKDITIKTAKMLFLKYGIRNVTMDIICKEVGISKKTLYQIFESKAILVAEVVKCMLATEFNTVKSITDKKQNPINEMLDIGQNIMHLLSHTTNALFYELQKYYPTSWQLIVTHQQKYIHELMSNNLTKGINLGLYRKDISPLVITQYYTNVIKFITSGNVKLADNQGITDAYLQFILYHLYGITTIEGRKYLKDIDKKLRPSFIEYQNFKLT